MIDYTEKGVVAMQRDIAISYLGLMDDKLAKIKRRVTLLTVIAAASLWFSHKDKILAFKNKKGE